MGTAPQGLKEGLRAMWMAGDFGRIALHQAAEAERFVDRLGIQPGMRVLDVACGSGNLAIPAAKRGAVVTGVDIAPNLVAQARARAAAEGITATFDEGDAEALPYGDGSFDIVMTMYGAMFAPRPDVTAAELARVCRSGGTIAMANWTPRGFVGAMFALTARHAPPPEGVEPPARWGDDAIVRERLGPYTSRIQTTPRRVRLEYPFPPREVVQYFREYFGPTKTAFARLDEAGQAALAAESESLWSAHNQAGPDHTRAEAEYLEVLATRK
jgi:ubiquinone/menaquinone biosynthesis C-methylase UbiE